MPALRVIWRASKKALRAQSRTMFVNYVQVPLGIVALLFPCWALEILLHHYSIGFPPSIIVMLLVFIFLLFLNWISPHGVFPFVWFSLRPSVNWSLSTVGIFMTPSFITLPAHSSLTLAQVGLICAWFLPPILVTWSLDILLCKMISKAIPFPEEDSGSLKGRSKSRNRTRTHSRNLSAGTSDHSTIDDERWVASPEPEGTDSEDEGSPRTRAVTLDHQSGRIRTSIPAPSSLPNGELNRRSGTNTQAFPGPTNRLSQAGDISADAVESTTYADVTRRGSTREGVGRNLEDGRGVLTRETVDRSADSSSSSFAQQLITVDVIAEPISSPAPLPEFELSHKLSKLVDLVVYVLVFLVGVALFYTPRGERRSQVIFIAMIALIWLFSRRIIPHSWTKVLHPTLTTSLLASFAILGIGTTKGLDRKKTYDIFYKNTTYLEFLNPRSSEGLTVPGAGDILESFLDAGTVGLAFIIFDYRRDLYHNWFRIFLVIVPNCALCLLVWPYLARLIGILPTQALDFSARSISAPLALEFLKIVGGDRNLGVILVYLTGITVTILRGAMFRLFRIRTARTHEDYFTVGVTVGSIGAVIGTSQLFKRHRRAAGTATVALVMFAVIMLCLVSVPQPAKFLSDLAGISKDDKKKA